MAHQMLNFKLALTGSGISHAYPIPFHLIYNSAPLTNSINKQQRRNIPIPNIPSYPTTNFQLRFNPLPAADVAAVDQQLLQLSASGLLTSSSTFCTRGK
jgi:hypothetical protein